MQQPLQTQQQQQIIQIFNQNSVDDLNKFLYQRHCLNQFNVCLVYLFYLVQSAGILLTTIATNYNNSNLVYVGVGLNLLASMINVYEKINNSILKNMMDNIQAIKDNKYVDESALVDLESINAQTPPASTTVPPASTTVPPASTTVPPASTTVLPASTTVPPASTTNTLPPQENH